MPAINNIITGADYLIDISPEARTRRRDRGQRHPRGSREEQVEPHRAISESNAPLNELPHFENGYLPALCQAFDFCI